MKLNKKGFTLVEVLAVIIILSILMAIMVPTVNHIIIKNSSDNDKILKASIINAAKVYMSDNRYNVTLTSTCTADNRKISIYNDEIKDSKISVQTLVDKKYLKTPNGEIINPKDKTKILDLDEAKVTIEFNCDTKDYIYNFEFNDLYWITNNNKLSEAAPGSYVLYEETKKNGWRIAYVLNGSAYLISSDIPEKVGTPSYENGKLITINDISNILICPRYDTPDEKPKTYKLDTENLTFPCIKPGNEPNISELWNKGYKYTCNSEQIECEAMFELYDSSLITDKFTFKVHIQDDNVHEADASVHIDNLNHVALKYCIKKYAYNGKCDKSSTWNINDNDFKKITITGKSLDDCWNKKLQECGAKDDDNLINIGENYWYSSAYNYANSNYVYKWIGSSAKIYASPNIGHSNEFGIRPIIKLKPDIKIKGGKGTVDDPYRI